MPTPSLEELPTCPVETTLMLIGNKWQVLILRDLNLNGTMRFKELQRSIGTISAKVLTSNLRAMEDTGIVRREIFAEVPPRVEYSLTELGVSLQPVLDAMRAWGEGYKKRLEVP
ncbi:MAG: helix-turn-helix transcriptional regulator [Atopobiaceae bacterium]|nr:helix-turn-helix transcriptional regulator [Atopobiaceae bacterium]MDO4404650.1 helix-turn-helix domain-containing protein [Atopobiaceae bacterium]